MDSLHLIFTNRPPCTCLLVWTLVLFDGECSGTLQQDLFLPSERAIQELQCQDLPAFYSILFLVPDWKWGCRDWRHSGPELTVPVLHRDWQVGADGSFFNEKVCLQHRFCGFLFSLSDAPIASSTLLLRDFTSFW